MSDERLHSRLELLQQACATVARQIDADIDTCQQERGTVWSDIQALQRRLEQLQQHERELRDMLASQAEQCADEQRDTAVAALRDSFASFIQGHGYWIQRARLENRIQALWNEDPLLETKIEAYHKVEANADDYLLGIPELLRDAMAQTLRAEQEKIHAQIAPFLELQAELGALRPEQPFALQIVVVHEPEDALISWILPFPTDEVALPANAAPVLSQVADEVMRGIGNLSKHQGWSVEDIDTANWEGFVVLLALATYNGEQPVDAAAQMLLTDILRAVPLFRGVDLNVCVDRLPHAAWRRGRQDIKLVASGAAEDLEDELEERDAEQPLRETSQGWYTNEDLRSWGRKKESKLTPQARRLRTLLMRMIGRGMVDGAAAPVDLLCGTLPPKHAAEMRRGIDSLISAGLLRSAEAAPAAAGVTINPDMLADVQSLINREPTEIWASIISSTPSVA